MMAEIEKDEKFYMTLVTIQVENRLFRIPRRSLEAQSRIFQDMFSLPVAENAEGSSDSNPIRLEGITKEEFKSFLEVLFTGNFEQTANPPLTFDVWFPVVKLSRMWECDAIHAYAIKNMPYNQVQKPSVEKVGLAVQYGIQPWLLPGLNELAKRKEPLGTSDLELLGPELALKVAVVRESMVVIVDDSGRPEPELKGKKKAGSSWATGYNSDPYCGQCGRNSTYYSQPALIAGERNASTIDFTPVIRRVFQI